MPDLIWQTPVEYQAYKLQFAIKNMNLSKISDKNIALHQDNSHLLIG
ncbi:hypothetical protein [Klebsiella pasteurii]|nr:hypothetical protein SB6412_03409 [Klebsiella pasteurii]